MKNYYISDLHIGHHNALKFDNRPFANCKEQNNVLLENINRVVLPEDKLYFLGDLSWYNPEITLQFLQKINCKNKFLIVGNHDRWVKNEACKKQFHGIYDLKRISDEGRIVILCHYPLAVWDQSHRGSIHLYGHVHDNKNDDKVTDTHTILNHEEMKNAYNVGCMLDYMNYTPRTLDEIIQSNKK